MSQFFIASGGGSTPSNVPTSFVTDNGTAIPDLNVLNVLGGSGIETYVDPNMSNNLFIRIQNSVTDTGQTIDDETITLSTIDCSAAGTYFFTTQLSSYSSGGNGIGGKLYTTAISDGVSLTVIDDTDSVAHRTAAFSSPGSTINYEIVNSGTDALLQVTGEDTFTIDWGAITVYVFRS